MKVLQPPGWAPPRGYANGVKELSASEAIQRCGAAARTTVTLQSASATTCVDTLPR